MYDIDSEIERRKKCWNERFKQCLKDKKMTQAGFADVLNKQYNNIPLRLNLKAFYEEQSNLFLTLLRK